MTDLGVIGRAEVASAVVELIGKGGQTSRMMHSKIAWQLSRQTKEHLTDPYVMVSPVVRLGTIVQASVAGHVDLTGEDLVSDRKEQGLTNSQQSGPSMVVTVHRDEVGIVDDEVTVPVLVIVLDLVTVPVLVTAQVLVTVQVSETVPVLETAVKEQMQMMPTARTTVVLTTNKEGKHRISREIEEVSVNGESGKDLRKMPSDQDSMTEEVAESLFVVAEVEGVHLVEVGEVLTDLEKETTIDILKGMFVSVFTGDFLVVMYFVIHECSLYRR